MFIFSGNFRSFKLSVWIGKQFLCYQPSVCCCPLVIFLEPIWCNQVHSDYILKLTWVLRPKNSIKAKSCREVEEKRGAEILLYSHDRNVLHLLLASSCFLGKETTTRIMRNDSKVTVARFNYSIVLGKSFIFHQWNSKKTTTASACHCNGTLVKIYWQLPYFTDVY